MELLHAAGLIFMILNCLYSIKLWGWGQPRFAVVNLFCWAGAAVAPFPFSAVLSMLGLLVVLAAELYVQRWIDSLSTPKK